MLAQMPTTNKTHRNSNWNEFKNAPLVCKGQIHQPDIKIRKEETKMLKEMYTFNMNERERERAFTFF